MNFNASLALEHAPSFLAGMVTTLLIVLPVMLFAALIAVPMALARNSRSRAWRAFAQAYVAVFRGAPTLVLLYLVYNGFADVDAVRNGPLWFLFSNAYFCAVLALTLNHSGYVTEILAGGLSSVPAGVVEAGNALSLNRREIFLGIKLPLAIRYGLKSYENEVLIFLKSTAAVSAITVTDLMAAANGIFDLTYDPFTPLVTAGVLYWLMTNAFQLLFALIDRRLSRHLPAAPKQVWFPRWRRATARTAHSTSPRQTP